MSKVYEQLHTCVTNFSRKFLTASTNEHYSLPRVFSGLIVNYIPKIFWVFDNSNFFFTIEKNGLVAVNKLKFCCLALGKSLLSAALLFLLYESFPNDCFVQVTVYTLKSSNLRCLGFKINATKVRNDKGFFGFGITDENWCKWKCFPHTDAWCSDGTVFKNNSVTQSELQAYNGIYLFIDIEMKKIVITGNIDCCIQQKRKQIFRNLSKSKNEQYDEYTRLLQSAFFFI